MGECLPAWRSEVVSGKGDCRCVAATSLGRGQVLGTPGKLSVQRCPPVTEPSSSIPAASSLRAECWGSPVECVCREAKSVGCVHDLLVVQGGIGLLFLVFILVEYRLDLSP